MGDTNIQWTDAVWNCVRGCSRVSRGCGDSTGGGCYAERQAIRFAYKGGPYKGLVKSTSHGPRWTGKVQLVESMLDLPLRWRKPRRIFVNSMSDLFHENLSDEAIFRVFMVMQAAKRHTFQVLTKRPERMRDFARKWKSGDLPMPTFGDGDNPRPDQQEWTWPLPNVWLGVSVEDQATADARIPVLLNTPAAVRFVSYEPALGAVDFSPYLGDTPSHATNTERGDGVSGNPARRTGDRRAGPRVEDPAASRDAMGSRSANAAVQAPPRGEPHGSGLPPGPRDGGLEADPLYGASARVAASSRPDSSGADDQSQERQEGRQQANEP